MHDTRFLAPAVRRVLGSRAGSDDSFPVHILEENRIWRGYRGSIVRGAVALRLVGSSLSWAPIGIGWTVGGAHAENLVFPAGHGRG